MVRYYSRTLDNGLRVFLSPDRHLHSIGISLGVNYGFFNESNSESGIAHLIEHMFFEGTNKFNKSKLRRMIDSDTIYWNGETEGELTNYKFKLLDASKNKQVFNFVKEMAFDSAFAEDNLEKEKNAAINEISGNFGSELGLEGAITRAYLFKKPVNAFFGGSPKTIKELVRDELVKTYKQYYTPKNSVLSVTGNFDRNSVMRSINDNFSGIESTGGTPKMTACTGRTDYREIHLNNFNPYKGQSRVIFGIKLPGAEQLYRESEKGRASLGQIRAILTKRLMSSLRDQTGIAYEAYSDIDISRYTGYMAIFSQVKNENLEESMKAVFSEIENLIEGNICKKEVYNAKFNAKVALAECLDSAQEHADLVSTSVLKYGKTPYGIYDEYSDIGVDDLRKAAADYLKMQGAENSVLLISS